MITDRIYGQFEEHVKPGEFVWYAGDLVDPVEKIVVGESRHSEQWMKKPNIGREHCYEAVNSFWNKVYFQDRKDAERVRNEYVGKYFDWLCSGAIKV